MSYNTGDRPTLPSGNRCHICYVILNKTITLGIPNINTNHDKYKVWLVDRSQIPAGYTMRDVFSDQASVINKVSSAVTTPDRGKPLPPHTPKI